MYESEPFRPNIYMPRTRFELILLSLCYTNRKDVEYNGGFFHMHQMEKAWNIHIADEFNLSQINMLVKAMTEWTNNYAPIFTSIGLKPDLFGNERKTFCGGLNYILWRGHIVERKYHS